MKLISPSYEILDDIGVDMLKSIEKYGRVCYKSEGKITDDSYIRFIRNILKRGHESVLEHEKVSVRIICDRGVSHELVRHRIASFSQESTRYCNYASETGTGQISFIIPCFFAEESDQIRYNIWEKQMVEAEIAYTELISLGARPEEARSVLPNSLKTELVMTMNLREWRHFFKLRTAAAAHPQMREITIPMCKEFKEKLYPIFDDIDV